MNLVSLILSNWETLLCRDLQLRVSRAAAILSRCQQHQHFSRNTPTPITQRYLAPNQEMTQKNCGEICRKTLQFYCDDGKSLLCLAAVTASRIFQLFSVKSLGLLFAAAAKIPSSLYSETKTFWALCSQVGQIWFSTIETCNLWNLNVSLSSANCQSLFFLQTRRYSHDLLKAEWWDWIVYLNLVKKIDHRLNWRTINVLIISVVTSMSPWDA